MSQCNAVVEQDKQGLWNAYVELDSLLIFGKGENPEDAAADLLHALAIVNEDLQAAGKPVPDLHRASLVFEVVAG